MTKAIIMRNREGCQGGGKGPLLSEELSLTLAANANDQVLFVEMKSTKTIAVRTAQTSANGHGIATEVAHTLDQSNGQAICAEVSPCRKINNGKNSDAAMEAQSLVAEIPEVCGTLSDGAHMGGGQNGQDAYTGRIIPAPIEQCSLPEGLQGSTARSRSRRSADSDASRRFL